MTDPCKTYLAIDLGASSGRVMAGRYQGRKLTIEEVHRFPNSGVETGDGWHWDFEGLFQSIVEWQRSGMAQRWYLWQWIRGALITA
jgi:rhamnulokinase